MSKNPSRKLARLRQGLRGNSNPKPDEAAAADNFLFDRDAARFAVGRQVMRVDRTYWPNGQREREPAIVVTLDNGAAVVVLLSGYQIHEPHEGECELLKWAHGASLSPPPDYDYEHPVCRDCGVPLDQESEVEP